MTPRDRGHAALDDDCLRQENANNETNVPSGEIQFQTRCDFPRVSAGQDAVQALYASRGALKVCEGKRRDWQKFYGHIRAKR